MSTRRMALMAGPSLLAVALWLGLVVLPGRASGDAVEERLLAAESQIEILTSQLARSSELGSNIDQLSIQLVELDRAVPSDPDVDGFVRLADRVAVASGVEVDQVSPRPDGPVAGGATQAQSTSVDLLVEGTYAQLMSFLVQLTSAERVVLIDQIEIQSALGTDGSLTANLTVRVFSTSAAAPAAVDVTTETAVGATLEAQE